MGLYKFVLLVHVLSAILGLGPGFIMIYVVTRATNMTELRHAYLRNGGWILAVGIRAADGLHASVSLADEMVCDQSCTFRGSTCLRAFGFVTSLQADKSIA